MPPRTSNLAAGSVVPMPTLPLWSMRSLSTPSVVTLKCPSVPLSTTSASVFPSEILSTTPEIVVFEAPYLII